MKRYRERVSGYLREGPGGVNLEKWGLYASLAGGAYLLWQLYQTITNPNKGTAFEGTGVVGTAANVMNQVSGGLPEKIGRALGGGLYSLFNPGSADRAISPTFMVYFPSENALHAIPSNQVSNGGVFSYGSQRYRIVILKTVQTMPNGVRFSKVAMPL